MSYLSGIWTHERRMTSGNVIRLAMVIGGDKILSGIYNTSSIPVSSFWSNGYSILQPISNNRKTMYFWEIVA